MPTASHFSSIYCPPSSCRYNNKTYRIDDIAWDKNPQSTFLDHKGNAICFIDYYKWVMPWLRVDL